MNSWAAQGMVQEAANGGGGAGGSSNICMLFGIQVSNIFHLAHQPEFVVSMLQQAGILSTIHALLCLHFQGVPCVVAA